MRIDGEPRYNPVATGRCRILPRMRRPLFGDGRVVAMRPPNSGGRQSPLLSRAQNPPVFRPPATFLRQPEAFVRQPPSPALRFIHRPPSRSTRLQPLAAFIRHPPSPVSRLRPSAACGFHPSPPTDRPGPVATYDLKSSRYQSPQSLRGCGKSTPPH